MVGGRAGTRCILFLTGTAALATPAYAGAWSQPDGKGLWSSTISRTTGDFGEAWRTDDYAEYGIGAGFNVDLKVEGEIRPATTAAGLMLDDRTGISVGIQKAFALTDRASFAIRASYLGGEPLYGPDCQGEGYEARAAVGTSFSLFGAEGFVNAEGGHWSRGDGCERDVVELAAGIEFLPDWNLTLKSWGERGDGARSAKVEAAISHSFGMLSLGVGWRQEISGDFEEKGWVITAAAPF